MTIAAYLKSRKQTVEQFAAQVGVNVATVYRHLNAEVEPKAGTIQRYVEGTKGAVTARDVFEEYQAAFVARSADRKSRAKVG